MNCKGVHALHLGKFQILCSCLSGRCIRNTLYSDVGVYGLLGAKTVMKKFKDFVLMGTLLHLCSTAFSTETLGTAKKSRHPDTLISSTDDLIAIESVVQPHMAVPAFQSKWEKENLSIQKSLYEHIKKPRKEQSLVYDSRHELQQITNHDNRFETVARNTSNDISLSNDISKYSPNENVDSDGLEDKAYHSDFVTNDQYSPNLSSQNEPAQSYVNSHEDYSKSDTYGNSPRLSYTTHASADRSSLDENYEIPEKQNCTYKQYEPNNYGNPEVVANSDYRTNVLLTSTINRNQIPSAKGRNDIIIKSNFDRETPRHGYEKQEFNKSPRSYLHMLKDAQNNMHYHVHNHEHTHNHHHLHGHKYNHLAGHIGAHQNHPVHNNHYRIEEKQRQQQVFDNSYIHTHNDYDPQHHSLQEFHGLKPNTVELNKFQNIPDRSMERHQNYRPIGSNGEGYESAHKKIKDHEYNYHHSEHNNLETENDNPNGYHGYNYDNGIPDKTNTDNIFAGNSKYGPGHTDTVSYTSESTEHTSPEEFKSNAESREQLREFDSKSSLKDIASNEEYSRKHHHHNYNHNSAENDENHSSDDYRPQDGRNLVHHSYDPRSSPNAQSMSNNELDNNDIRHPVNNHETFHQTPPMNEPISSTPGYEYGLRVKPHVHNFLGQQGIINQGSSFNQNPGSLNQGSSFNQNPVSINQGSSFNQNPISINQGSSFKQNPISINQGSSFNQNPVSINQGSSFNQKPVSINQGFSSPAAPIPREPFVGKIYIKHGNDFANEPRKPINSRPQKYTIHKQKLSDIQDPLVLPRNARIIEHHIGLPPILFRSFETPVVLGHSVRYAVHKIVPNPLKVGAFHHNSHPQIRNLQAVQTQQHLTLYPKWL